MKSRAELYHRQRAYRRTPEGRRMAEEETKLIVNRNMAITLGVLHREFGFGPDRMCRFLRAIKEFSDEQANNPTWYDELSHELEEYLGMPFFRADWMEQR